MSLRQYIRILLEQAMAPKVIFMAGGPGSGKSTVINSLGLSGRLEVINPDDAYEAAMAAENIPSDRQSLLDEYVPIKQEYEAAQEAGDLELVAELEPGYTRLRGLLSRNMQLFAAARKDAKARQLELLETGKDFLVDGTGGNSKEILKTADKLKEVGFEVGMIFVDVSMETSVARDHARGEAGRRRLGRKTVERSWNSVNRNFELYQDYFGDNFFRIDADKGHFEQSIEDSRTGIQGFLA